jgi:hypothetical protein
MTAGVLDRIKQVLQSLYLVSAPDHPATGGNTGDAEWPPEDAETAQSPEEDDR